MSNFFDSEMNAIKVTTLEERTLQQVKHNRRWFLGSLAYYRMDMPGGSRYLALVESGKQKEADEIATRSEHAMKHMCAEALMTTDGKSTDERLPIDDMYDWELESLHQGFQGHAYRFSQMLKRMLLGAPSFSAPVLRTLFTGITIHYNDTLYERGHVAEEFIGIKMPIAYDIQNFLDGLAEEFSKKYSTDGIANGAKAAEVARMSDDFHRQYLVFFSTFVPKTYADFKNNTKPMLALEAPAVMH